MMPLFISRELHVYMGHVGNNVAIDSLLDRRTSLINKYKTGIGIW